MHRGLLHSPQAIIALTLPLTSTDFLSLSISLASSEATGIREGLSLSEGSCPYTLESVPC